MARTSARSSRAALALLGDERLARLATAGHERAFAVVYERYHQALYRYCRSILRDDADAQDALQSTFTAAFAALGHGRRDAPIRPWLFRIAHNEAVSVLRRRRPTAELSEATDYRTTSVEDQVTERAELGLLLRDLHELHERQRSALVMRELSGLSHEEIALVLETSVGAAKQAIYEARRSLFEFAEGRAMPCDDIQRTISDADGRLLRGRRVRAHMRDCSACAAFAEAVPARRRELRALAPPLPAVAAAGLLERAAELGAGHSAGSGLAGLATGAAGKAAGAALAANALAGVAVVATATVGVTIGVDKLAHTAPRAGAGPHVVSGARSAGPNRRPTLAVAPTPAPAPAPRTVSPVAAAVSPAVRAVERHRVATPQRSRPSASTRASTPSSAGRSAPTMAAAPPAASTATTAPAHGDGHGTAAPGRSSSAPGHSSTTSTSPGHSAAAPGHSSKTSTSPGHSAAAPGHSSTTSTSPGHSAAAPGHSSTSSTSPGHSSSAPGHLK